VESSPAWRHTVESSPASRRTVKPSNHGGLLIIMPTVVSAIIMEGPLIIMPTVVSAIIKEALLIICRPLSRPSSRRRISHVLRSEWRRR
jgi:hypothetical protein